MGIGTLAQVAIDLFLGIGIFLCAVRLTRAPKDDPRLSRGLQLLQSKISVLEDLSDRSDLQAKQLTLMLEQKSREVQVRIGEAERHVREIQTSIERSREVARMFEDKIPHHEIIERRNTAKYVQAARLAHRGASPAEIASQVDLPMGEIEFIAKVNKDRLMFAEDQLPWWAEGRPSAAPPPGEPSRLVSVPAISAPRQNLEAASLERLGDEFRRVAPAPPPDPSLIRKVEFRRLDR